MIDKNTLAHHNLTEEEYRQIVELIGREPNLTELGIFSVMWSEHCGYKSSKVHLRKLPSEGSHVVQGPGENAGILDIGDGLVVVFKIESHNHPSFIEPYQGAATGVGGHSLAGASPGSAAWEGRGHRPRPQKSRRAEPRTSVALPASQEGRGHRSVDTASRVPTAPATPG